MFAIGVMVGIILHLRMLKRLRINKWDGEITTLFPVFCCVCKHKKRETRRNDAPFAGRVAGYGFTLFCEQVMIRGFLRDKGLNRNRNA